MWGPNATHWSPEVLLQKVIVPDGGDLAGRWLRIMRMPVTPSLKVDRRTASPTHRPKRGLLVWSRETL